MRITYRNVDNKEYWSRRWASTPSDTAEVNPETYPLKYALSTVTANDGPILEAGCGAGRILRYYHEHGYDITGFDFIELAISRLREADPTLKVETADIRRLHYSDSSFRYVLAFGLYHNLEHGLNSALSETLRVLMPGGRLCASFRADNVQNRVSDWLETRKAPRRQKTSGVAFHKRNLTRREFIALLESAGFVINKVEAVENMPVLYKFRTFRAISDKEFDERKARAQGYRLSKLGQNLQGWLMRRFPNQFCNVYVIMANKP